MMTSWMSSGVGVSFCRVRRIEKERVEIRKEFRMSTGWAVFYRVASLLASAFAVGVLIEAFICEDNSPQALVAIGVVCGFVIGLCVLVPVFATKMRYIVDDEKITSTGVFGMRELRFDDIEGVRGDGYTAYFVPKAKGLRAIKVPLQAGFGKVLEWAAGRFVNLDAQERARKLEAVLASEKYGRNENERAHSLTRARKMARFLEVLFLLVGASLVVYPRFPQIQVLICSAFPVIGLIAARMSGGLIRFWGKEDSVHPDLSHVFVALSVALMIRAVLGFSVLDYANLWWPMIVVLCVSGFLLMANDHVWHDFKKGATYLTVLGSGLLLIPYSYGFVVVTNGVFDSSQPEVYDAEILDKWTEDVGLSMRYLGLSEWGPRTGVGGVLVSKELYESKEVGGSVEVYLKEGLYGIPHYSVAQ
jgi:hypothetical protein